MYYIQISRLIISISSYFAFSLPISWLYINFY